jgi:4Fe-4S dicluster domain
MIDPPLPASIMGGTVALIVFHTGQVDVDNQLPALLGQFPHAAACHRPRVGDDHVQPPEPAHALIDDVVHAFVVERAKHLHIGLAPLNVMFSRRPDALGPLEPMRSGGTVLDFEEADPEVDVFGIGKVEDLTWKGLLDLGTCTECGRCQSQCPAWATGKPLSPKRPLAGTAEANGAIDPEVIWSHTNCGACVDERGNPWAWPKTSGWNGSPSRTSRPPSSTAASPATWNTCTGSAAPGHWKTGRRRPPRPSPSCCTPRT